MKNITIPIIIISCYLIGEIYKIIIKDKEQLKKYIPLITTTSGALISLLFYALDIDTLIAVESYLEAIEIGIALGGSSTGINQLIKQILTKKGQTKNEYQ